MVSRKLAPQVKKEYDDIQAEKQYIKQYIVKIDQSASNSLNVYIFGRKNSFHENGIFKLNILLTDQYPQKQPVWKFQKPYPYNSHIYSDGRQSSSLLYTWKQDTNLRILIESVIDVLYQNNGGPSDNPFNCYKIFKENVELFNQNCKKQAKLCNEAFLKEV
ncbi:ubiquitin-conjugating enzyme [Tetrahymena thermophila SB210]|uniref:Ubiquitin-conjugating enzyme n=1 Tax=Tetrahymena thermophila (strain SB210) TaxID=312017 RepID=A0A1B9C297_TETTS|nr:ubiquitin-conjugating enzyme [Tetrahymena thermophila SB210]